MNGESINHQELTERLRRVQDAGIQVLVIPGNHDINNTNAAVYFGDEKKQTPSVTGDEFLELYYDYSAMIRLSAEMKHPSATLMLWMRKTGF